MTMPHNDQFRKTMEDNVHLNNSSTMNTTMVTARIITTKVVAIAKSTTKTMVILIRIPATQEVRRRRIITTDLARVEVMCLWEGDSLPMMGVVGGILTQEVGDVVFTAQGQEEDRHRARCLEETGLPYMPQALTLLVSLPPIAYLYACLY